MTPEPNLYKVTFEKLSNVFFVVATDFGDAQEKALQYALKYLEMRHQTVTSIKLVAVSCDIIGTLTPANLKEV
jgi:hypothetical protein